MSKQICLNVQQHMLLTLYLGDQDNFPIFDRKIFREIADIAAEALGFEISQSTVRGIWNARRENNFAVWESPERKKKLSVAEEIAGLKEVVKEQDKKFKILFRLLHELTRDTEESLQGELNKRNLHLDSFNFNNGGGDGAELVD